MAKKATRGGSSRAKRATTAVATQPEVLPALDSHETRTFTENMTLVAAVMPDLDAFLSEAKQRRDNAAAALEEAKRLEVPTSQEEDAVVQRLAKAADTAKAQEMDFWDRLTKPIYALHRACTQARKIATDNLQAASEITNALHSSYRRAEQLRVQQEQERINREIERKQQEQADREADRIEAEVLAREAQMPELTDRESKFVAFLMAGSTAASAAKMAHFRNPDTRGPALLETAKIQEALRVKREQKALADHAEVTRSRPENIPVSIPRTEAEKPRTATGIATDREFRSAEVYDADAFLAAVLDPAKRMALGIPADAVTYQQTVLNRCARDYGAIINNWPGVKLKVKEKLV